MTTPMQTDAEVAAMIAREMLREADWCRRNHANCNCGRILRTNGTRVAQHLKQENAKP